MVSRTSSMRLSLLLLLALPVEGFFSNSAIRTAFKAATSPRGVAWPTVLPTVKNKTLPECQHYDPSVQFPDYYRQDFHAYDRGNLNPVAAVEAMAMTEATMAFHYQGKSGAEANDFVRSTFNTRTRQETEKSELAFRPKTVIDMGCGIGVSTNFLACLRCRPQPLLSRLRRSKTSDFVHTSRHGGYPLLR